MTRDNSASCAGIPVRLIEYPAYLGETRRNEGMAELTWEDKYDKDGRRVPPVRIALPFQTVETVNESAQERQKSLDIFSEGRAP